MNNIEILEHFLEMEDYENKEDFLQAIKNLIKENKELKNKCNELNFKYTAQWVDDNFIPKSKVKEKIEYIEKNYGEHSEFSIGKSIEFLQELLEEGE